MSYRLAIARGDNAHVTFHERYADAQRSMLAYPFRDAGDRACIAYQPELDPISWEHWIVADSGLWQFQGACAVIPEVRHAF